MRHSQRGITLLELMIVTAIVALLASIAYPSYRDQVLRSKRAEAKNGLMQNAQALENCFTRFSAYNNASCAIATTLNSAAGVTTPDGSYKITGGVSGSTFLLTATPQGGQTRDTKCMNFTLTEQNVRGVSGTGSTVATCWR